MEKKAASDFKVKPFKAVECKGAEAEFPVRISMLSEESVGITIDNMGRSSLAEVAAHFYNLGHQHGTMSTNDRG